MPVIRGWVERTLFLKLSGLIQLTGYKADMATAQALFTTVQRLLDLAEKVYARYMLA